MATSHLRALQALELAVRKGSLKAAAEALAITPAALGQRIKTLEEYLGYDLLVRGRTGIRPTRELAAASAHLNAAFRELETVCRILDFQRVDEIQVTADSDWADLWLKPRLASFVEEYPNTRFCINGTGDVPMRLGDADCEIWFGAERGRDGEELLFRDYLVPVSSPANTQRISTRPTAEMLEGFPLLHLDCYTVDVDDIGWIEWIEDFGHRRTAPGRGIRYQRVVHALEAVTADAGLLVCGLALIAPLVEGGVLSLPFPIEEGRWSKNGYRVHFRPSALRRNRIELFREWLLGQARETEEDLARSTPKT